MKSSSTSKDPQIMEAEAKLDTLIEELKVKKFAFQKEMEMRGRLINNRIETMRHNLSVAQHDLAVDARRGIEKISKSAKNILSP